MSLYRKGRLYELVEYYLRDVNESIAFKIENKLHIQVRIYAWKSKR